MEKDLVLENNLEDFIEKQPYSSKMIKDCRMFIIIFGIVTGFIGMHYYITMPITIITLVWMIIWGNKIIKDDAINQYYVYLGCCFVILSLEMLLGTYKLYAINRDVSVIEGLLILMSYVVFIALYTNSYIRKIQLKEPKKKKTGLNLFICFTTYGNTCRKKSCRKSNE